MTTRRQAMAGAAAVAMALAAAPCAALAGEADLGPLIGEAYHYAFPLYKLSQYRWTALNTTGSRTSTVLHRFAHSRAIARPEDRWANSPIVDALYSTAWIDLGAGPVLVETPDTGERYFVLTLIDAWSNTFFYAGHRATGTRAQRHYLVPPGWQGEAPAGTTLVRAPTPDVYVNLRVQVDGADDLPAAHRVQDGFRLVPAAALRRGAPPVDRVPPTGTDARNFVDVVNQMLALDPPPERDRALIERYRAVGLCGAACRWTALPADVQAAWHAAYAELEAGFFKAHLAAGTRHGWIEYNPPGSKLGSADQPDHRLRAASLALGMGILGVSPDEANYWITFSDSRGQPLTGASAYRLRLPPGGIPVQAFWSVTLYSAEKDGQFLVPNALGRHHVGSRTPGLVRNADGSIDLWIQPSPPPAERRANWLPTPADGRPFTLFARAYEPGPAIRRGTFRMPEVEPLP